MSDFCFNFIGFELCAYELAPRATNYFVLGHAVSALAFTLALQNFLKPIYRLRLAVRSLSIGRLYVVIFGAVGLTAFAAIVPQVPVSRSSWWGNSTLYELLAAGLFVFAYGAVAVAVTRPIKVNLKNVEFFARNAAAMLAEAAESDHVDFLPDTSLSLPRLIKLASFLENRRDVSAFWIFRHRNKIKQAQYAQSLLRIMSDPHFCRSIVNRAPWTVARIIKNVADEKIYSYFAEQVIQEIALQAIFSDDSIMSREVDLHGFGTAPILSESLFSEPFIVERYNPLQSHYRGEQITSFVLKRFNKAATRCFECLIERGNFDSAQVAFSIENFYQGASWRAVSLKQHDGIEIDYSMELGTGAKNAITLANKLLFAADPHTYRYLFVEDNTQPRHDVLEALVEIVFNALCGISKGFEGTQDPFWHLAIECIHDAYGSVGAEPSGLTPFQQRLTLKLVKKLHDNMNGNYPAVCRVLLATVGPYEQNAPQTNLTAFNILRNVMYRELKNLPVLARNKPEKLADYLPPSTKFDATVNILTHTYFGGTQRAIDLTSLELVDIDLFNQDHRRSMTTNERDAAAREIF